MVAPQRVLSLEEFLRLPEEKPAFEYEDGVVTQKMSPKARHSSVQGMFTELVNTFGRPQRLALAYPELRVTFGGRSYVPDVSVLRWERIPVDEQGRVEDDVFVPPDIAFEVVSPSQSMSSLFRRCVWYVKNGVPVAVAVDPDDETVFVFRPDATPLAAAGDERVDLDDVLPGFEMTADGLFASLRVG